MAKPGGIIRTTTIRVVPLGIARFHVKAVRGEADGRRGRRIRFELDEELRKESPLLDLDGEAETLYLIYKENASAT